jgi:hypothetical protein
MSCHGLGVKGFEGKIGNYIGWNTKQRSSKLWTCVGGCLILLITTSFGYFKKSN